MRSNRNKQTRRCLQSTSSRTRRNNNKEVQVTAKQKKVFVQPYVDNLVQLKLKSKKRIENNVYTKTIDDLKNVGINWITLDSLKSRVKRSYAKVIRQSPSSSVSTTNSVNINTTPPPPGALPSSTSRSIPTVASKGGRPKGSTNENKSLIDKCCAEATNEITKLYYAEYLKSKSNETDHSQLCTMLERVPKGTYQKIHDTVKVNRNLPCRFNFPYNTCKKRISKGLCTGSNNVSPLHSIEQHIVTLLLALAESGSPLTVGNGLPLINSLIMGTEHQQKVIQYKKKLMLHFDKDGNEKSDEELGSVGAAFWRGFLHRHKPILTTAKGRLFELN